MFPNPVAKIKGFALILSFLLSMASFIVSVIIMIKQSFEQGLIALSVGAGITLATTGLLYLIAFMVERIMAQALIKSFLQRPDINKAYAMVDESDPWYATIKKVHDSLGEITAREHRTVEIKSLDGLTLRGVYYPQKGAYKTVICVHGYTSHAEREWAYPGLYYLSLGYNVLIPYQRAHGLSEGNYITLGALERDDLTLWVKKALELSDGGDVVIHGLSMGGGIALLATPFEMEGVKAVIADAPSTSVRTTFENVAKHAFKTDGEKIGALAIKIFGKRFNVDVDTCDVLTAVKEGKYPVLLAAGSNENLEGLFQSIADINPKPTKTVILPGCDHGNGLYKQTELFKKAIADFLTECGL